jgi:hypothetical protein
MAPFTPPCSRPHVKDNSRRQFLQKTKKNAIFEGSKLKYSLLYCPNFVLTGLYANKEDNYYNAFEKDIAVVHFFFQVRLHTFLITRNYPFHPQTL